MDFVKNIIISCRPHHYLKNLFIFLPSFFAFKIFEPNALIESTLAFIGFSIAASSIYIINDIIDAEKDSLHNRKKFRPIASGKVPKNQAVYFSISLIFISLILGWNINYTVFGLTSFYILMNIAYTLALKNFAVLDIFIISLGFVIRIFVGSSASNVELTHWIVLLTFLLSLFLAFSKRRDDFVNNESEKTRRSINGYNLEFINASMNILAGMVVLSYILWSISPDVIERLGSNKIYFSSIFVMLGIFRYLQHVYLFKDTGSPTRILIKDKFIQFSILGWTATLYAIFYLS